MRTRRSAARELILALCLALAAPAAAAAAMSPATARTIAIAEDERQFRPDLESFLKDPDPIVRARAALAVGRLQDTTTVEALAPLLEDPSADVRREAVFALGQIGAKRAGPLLLPRLADREADVVSLVLEALGKLGDKANTRHVAHFLGVANATQRASAAVALWRLADSTALEPLIAHHDDPDPEVRWRVLYALEKIVEPNRVVLIAAQHATDEPEPLVRAYAVRTMGRQKSPHATAYLLQALDDPEIAVVINAVRALQLIADTTCVRCGISIAARLAHPHPYVRVTAATALGDRFALAAADSAARRAVIDSLTAHLGDHDPATRAAAARSLLQIRGAAALDRVDPLLRDTSIVTRTGVMDALRARAIERSQLDVLAPRLDPKAALPERLTAADVIGARHEMNGAALLRAGLADSSTLFVAACAAGLAEMKDSSSAPALAAAYARRKADLETDARLAIHDALRELVSAQFADSVAKANPAPEPARTYPDDFAEPPKERGVVLHTSKGDIEWSFYGHDAPQTVKNFVRLARRGYFNGNLFHRVVPNFVIQDGDPTGTGSGGPGYTIRCEYNRLHYTPGMVGMALSGKDTGGSQWFINHSPQLHLDGRYTIFAHVTRGMDVVQKIVQGDRVLRVDILE